MSEQTISVPDLGDFDEVDVIEILVQPGDAIAEGDSVVTLESEKAAMELPAPVGGVVKSIHVALGDKVGEGAPLVVVDTAATPGAVARSAGEGGPPAGGQGENQPPQPASLAAPDEETAASRSEAAGIAGEQPAQPAPPVAPDEETAAGRAAGIVKASPSVRRFARELGVDLQFVRGSGPKGRIVQEDVKDFARNAAKAGGAAEARGRPAPPALPQVHSADFSRFGPTEVIELDRVQSIVADRTHRAWLNVPHVTQHQDADITELEDRRKQLAKQWAGQQVKQGVKQGAKQETANNAGQVKLTLLAFLVKALALSLRDFPKFNTAFDNAGRLVQKHYCHIGIAVDAPGGLFVPVIRDADGKDVFEIARAIAGLASRARAGRLSAADMQGGCMTISNQGGIGGSAFTPIVNAPETATLGVSRARISPWWDGRAFVPRLLLPLDLSYDHRVVNGADAARFLDGYCRLLSGMDAPPPDTR